VEARVFTTDAHVTGNRTVGLIAIRNCRSASRSNMYKSHAAKELCLAYGWPAAETSKPLLQLRVTDLSERGVFVHACVQAAMVTSEDGLE
jgi:hypothetical protein